MDSCADHLQDHVLEHCKSITQKNRGEAQNHVKVTIKPTAGERPFDCLSRTSMKKKRRKQLEVGHFRMESSVSSSPLSTTRVVNRKLLNPRHVWHFLPGSQLTLLTRLQWQPQSRPLSSKWAPGVTVIIHLL